MTFIYTHTRAIPCKKTIHSSSSFSSSSSIDRSAYGDAILIVRHILLVAAYNWAIESVEMDQLIAIVVPSVVVVVRVVVVCGDVVNDSGCCTGV